MGKEIRHHLCLEFREISDLKICDLWIQNLIIDIGPGQVWTSLDTYYNMS